MSSYAAVAQLVNSRRLRAMYLAARRDVGSVDTHSEAAPNLLALTDAPFESVADARDRLDRLEGLLRRRDDRRAVFLTIYARMTRAVQNRIESGGFADPQWMRAYTVRFANYYREAFLAFERGRTREVPEPWRIAFGTAIAGDALIAQDAFLGINAHINYDLALTLRDVGVDPVREAKRADHRVVNDILARLVDAQQDALADLYASGIEDVDAALRRLDETLSLFTMSEAREQAWRMGVVLTEAHWRPVESYARWVLRATATGGAVFVLAPTTPPDVLRALERVEREGVDVEDTLEFLHSRVEAVEFYFE